MNQLDTLEAILKGSLQNGIQLTDILIAIHNVSAHGDNIGDGGPHDDDVLGKLFEGYDIAIKAARTLEGR